MKPVLMCPFMTGVLSWACVYVTGGYTIKERLWDSQLTSGPFPTHSRLSSAAAMTTTMMGLLGVLLCALAVRSEVPPQVDFDVQGVAGKWYLIGFATNAEWFVTRKANMKMGVAMLTPNDEGDLEMAYSSLNPDGTCWRMTHLAQKTDIPGKFTFHSDRQETENDMRVVDVKYDEYALIHTIKTNADSTTLLNKLYGRTPDLGQDVLDRFTEFSLEQDILPENISILPKNDECP